VKCSQVPFADPGFVIKLLLIFSLGEMVVTSSSIKGPVLHILKDFGFCMPRVLWELLKG